MLERGVHVGLGTDIAGGASPSILDNARHAIFASRRLEAGVDPALEPRARADAPGRESMRSRRFGSRPPAAALPWTSASACWRPGYAFDAIVVDAQVRDSNLALEPADAPETVLQKILYSAVRSNIRATYVAGRLVHSSATE